MSSIPVLVAYTIKDRGKDKKAVWTRIGAAWPHNSGSGLSIQLEALPIDGRIVLIEPRADAETFEGAR